MKYRVKKFYTKKAKVRVGHLRAKRKSAPVTVLPPIYQYRPERISLDMLFEMSALPAPSRPPRLAYIRSRLRAVAAAALRVARRAAHSIRLSLESKQPPRIAFTLGVLTSAILCTALSVCIVLTSLFGRFFLPYTLLKTPSLVGLDFSEIKDELEKSYQILVSYENSDTVSAGHIISQTPNAGVGRKIYKNRPFATLTLKVSMGKSFYTVESLQGQSSRTALLSLYNKGVAVRCVEEYSQSVDAGMIISTSPSVGARLFEGEVLTLKVSLGQEKTSVSMPDLYGLGEAQALSLLSERGLISGKITYKSSASPIGTVIEQAFAPYSSIASGSAVDITVSIGISQSREVPDLYGLSRNEAQLRLAEVGLVLGSVISVDSGAPQGTVISQYPIAGTQITSSLTSVDIYISW